MVSHGMKRLLSVQLRKRTKSVPYTVSFHSSPHTEKRHCVDTRVPQQTHEPRHEAAALEERRHVVVDGLTWLHLDLDRLTRYNLEIRVRCQPLIGRIKQ